MADMTVTLAGNANGGFLQCTHCTDYNGEWVVPWSLQNVTICYWIEHWYDLNGDPCEKGEYLDIEVQVAYDGTSNETTITVTTNRAGTFEKVISGKIDCSSIDYDIPLIDSSTEPYGCTATSATCHITLG